MSDSKKIIIVAPHPDDEIFAIKKLSAIQGTECSVSVLYLSGTSKRIEEATRSCSYLRFETIVPAKSLFTDGLFHENFEEVKEVIAEIAVNYDCILAPALEGGHQDHDTVALGILLAMKKFTLKEIEIYFFPCYILEETSLYKVNSCSNYAESIMKPELFPNKIFHSERTLLGLLCIQIATQDLVASVPNHATQTTEW